jgi:hypothetical protein
MQLKCHAPHPKRQGECGSTIGAAPGALKFEEILDRLPDSDGNRVWARCSREGCKKWNGFTSTRTERLTEAQRHGHEASFAWSQLEYCVEQIPKIIASLSSCRDSASKVAVAELESLAAGIATTIKGPQ